MSDTQKHVLHVVERIELGKKAAQLRKVGQIPANVFGEEKSSQALSMRKSDTLRFLNAVGESGLLYLAIDGQTKEVPVLFDEIQLDPITQEPLHISFKRVNLREKVQAEVPVEMIGEVEIPGANIFLVKDMLEVEALPTDLPESIQVDISGLTEIGQSLHLADALYDREKVMVIQSEEDEESPLVIVQEVKEEVEEEPAAEEVGAETAEGEAATDESGEAAPAEEQAE